MRAQIEKWPRNQLNMQEWGEYQKNSFLESRQRALSLSFLLKNVLGQPQHSTFLSQPDSPDVEDRRVLYSLVDKYFKRTHILDFSKDYPYCEAGTEHCSKEYE
jgi:hypothetical protein